MGYDPTTDAGKVRLLISDVDPADEIFDDDEIAAFLALEGDNVRLAAAQALDTIASNEALVAKKQRTLDLDTDGPAVAKALREHAAQLRAQAIDGADGGGDFEIAELVVDPFTARDRLGNEILRGL